MHSEDTVKMLSSMLKLVIASSGREYLLDKVSFHKSSSIFLLESSEELNVSISVKFPMPVYDNYKSEDFYCIPFKTSKYFKEENVYEVHSEQLKRVGWIFPVQTLVSTEHSFASNEHFLRYAFVAFNKLLNGDYFSYHVSIEVDNINSELELTDIYYSRLIVMCISKAKVQTMPDFDISLFLHSLYGQKYFYCQNHKEKVDAEMSFETEAKAKIKIDSLSPYLKEEIFIKSLFREHLNESNHPLVQFHLLYQIIELLINKVYDSEARKITALINGGRKTSHEIYSEVSKLTTEDYRIKKIFESYTQRHVSSTELTRACNSLLSHFTKEKSDMAESFYQVRNLVVHNFRAITELKSGLTLLKEINDEFEALLIQILSVFDESDESREFIGKPTAWLMYKLLLNN